MIAVTHKHGTMIAVTHKHGTMIAVTHKHGTMIAVTHKHGTMIAVTHKHGTMTRIDPRVIGSVLHLFISQHVSHIKETAQRNSCTPTRPDPTQRSLLDSCISYPNK